MNFLFRLLLVFATTASTVFPITFAEVTYDTSGVTTRYTNGDGDSVSKTTYSDGSSTYYNSTTGVYSGDPADAGADLTPDPTDPNNFVGPPAPDGAGGADGATAAAGAQASPGAASSADSWVGSPCAPSDSDIDSSTVKEMLSRCKPGKVITSKGGDYTYSGWARQKAIDIANQLILIGSILSVGALVYAAILYTIAAGDEEKVKTAKNALKFGIIGFLMMLLSFPLVNAIVRLFYSTGG